jgi:hypothetical protein
MNFDPLRRLRGRPEPGDPPHDPPAAPGSRIRLVNRPSPTQGPAESSGPPTEGGPVPVPRRSALVVDPPPPRVPVAGRFATASKALRHLALLTASGRDDAATFYRGAGSWWVVADAEIDLARTAVDAARGTLYTHISGGWTPDHRSGDPAAIPQSELTRVPLIDLIATAPLAPAPAMPLHTATVFLPASVTDVVIRRALDLGIQVSYRLVRLSPLFGDGETTALAEVRLFRESDPIPPSLLAVAAAAPLAIVCRTADNDHLHIQHARVSPLPDQQLAALAGPDVWILADSGFGCWRLRPLGRYLPGTSLVVDRTAFTDDVQEPPAGRPTDADLEIPRARVRVIPRSTPGQRTDAVLLDAADLAMLPLLLERHPLGEVALVLRGRDRHLLTAAGGLLERLSVGVPLTCVGPGQLYVPLGHDFSPRLPGAARAALFGPDPRHAVVVLDGWAVRFAFANRLPVWCLWTGDVPEVDDQLPEGVDELLAQFRRPVKPTRPDAPPITGGHRGPRETRPFVQRDWREVALELENAGELARAAELHRRHNDPLRAARLYERVARHAAGT